jgi:predicted nucleotidyltransferase
MKAILEFNLPEDQADFDFAVQGGKMYSALWDISQELRRLWKYEELDEKEWAMVERIRDKFYEILDDNQIKLDK